MVLRQVMRVPAIGLVALLLLSACGGAATPTGGGDESETLKVIGAFATQIEEPWDGVIHTALEAEADAGRIEYSFIRHWLRG